VNIANLLAPGLSVGTETPQGPYIPLPPEYANT